MVYRISNCYDSHTHYLATGQIASGLQLNKLASAEAIADVEIQSNYFRGDWLTGFGWDQNKWTNPQFPSNKILDQYFPDHPVLLSRVDGHASWVNSLALVELKKMGCDFQNENQVFESGILFEQDHIAALSYLPSYNDQQLQGFLLKSQSIFNQAGFTHVRDLSMNFPTWSALVALYNQKKLTVYLESFITVENLNSLDNVLNEVTQIKDLPCPQLRLSGVKIFLDGSLGSKTAFLSENYLGSKGCGLLMWDSGDLVAAFAKIWQKGLDVAVHCIGDQAAHVAIQAAREVSSQGILGRLHLEHVEVLRPETVQMMKPLHVTCHLQPCHWISDHSWLPKILPESLIKNIFPWELLRKNKIPFFFGSDAPIESPSLYTNQRALVESADRGVLQLQGDWKKYHSHPDSKWTNSWTEFSDEKVIQVYLNEKPLL